MLLELSKSVRILKISLLESELIVGGIWIRATSDVEI